ncbi:MAG: DUF3078 domain-containing protein [Bacteroidetes bacterium]|nr:DUF3078 domain-containing protein [Bacteroidota bacterium]
MKKILLSFVVLFSVTAYCQDQTVQQLKSDAAKDIQKDPADTIPKIWKKGGLYNINIAQGSLSNWAAGGDNFSLAINSYLNLYAFYKKGKHSWDNTLDFNLGYIKTTSLGDRKNDDRIDLLSKYGYAIGPKVNLSGLVNFRTQLFNGYTYPDDVKTLSSGFISPAYLLTSIGIDYKPTADLSIFISPTTSRWVIVTNDSLSAIGAYGVTPGKKSINEIGAFMSVNYMKAFNKIITYKGRLDLFSNYKKNPQNIDLFMSNVFAAKLSKVLSATWSIDMIYDDDVKLFGKNGTSPALQVKSLIGAGLQVKF